MVAFGRRSCKHTACVTSASFGIEGTKIANFCFKHAQDGMINVMKTHGKRSGGAPGSCTKGQRAIPPPRDVPAPVKEEQD